MMRKMRCGIGHNSSKKAKDRTAPNYTDAMLMTKDDYDHYYDEYCCFDLAVSLADHLFRLLCYAKRGSGNPYHPMLLET